MHAKCGVEILLLQKTYVGVDELDTSLTLTMTLQNPEL
jgi:hypothetical protein